MKFASQNLTVYPVLRTSVSYRLVPSYPLFRSVKTVSVELSTYPRIHTRGREGGGEGTDGARYPVKEKRNVQEERRTRLSSPPLCIVGERSLFSVPHRLVCFARAIEYAQRTVGRFLLLPVHFGRKPIPRAISRSFLP